jgi:hypothetical protein
VKDFGVGVKDFGVDVKDFCADVNGIGVVEEYLDIPVDG